LIEKENKGREGKKITLRNKEMQNFLSILSFIQNFKMSSPSFLLIQR